MASKLTVSVRAVPQLDAIGIVSSDLARTRAFYGLLGIEFAEGDDHVEATMPNGLRLMVDSEDVIRRFNPDWRGGRGRGGGRAPHLHAGENGGERQPARARLRVRQSRRGGRALRAGR